MSLGNCIPGMVRRGEIDPQRGARMQSLFDDLEAHYRESMGPDAAAAEASEATLRQLAAEAHLKKRQTLLQINRQRAAIKDVDSFTKDDPYAAVSALIDDDDRAPYRFGNVTTATQRIEFGVHRRIGDFIDRHTRNLLGRPKDRAGLDDMVRELHGQATGNERAKVFAQAIGEQFEALRMRFNAAGGNIRKLAGYGLPHRHDALRVRSAGRERWIADVTPLLDRQAMIDERTSLPFTDARLATVLGEVWETIRTNGLTGEPSAAFRSIGKLANRRAEHRFLHFADGDAWLRYADAYGAADDPFNAVIGHINGMAKDIAIMERLGPNPDATMRLLLDRADKAEAQSSATRVAAVEGTPATRAWAETLWRYVKGETSVPVIPRTAIWRGTQATVQGARNLNVAAMLGSAALSALSDTHTGALARRFYGLPETKVLSSYLRAFNPRTAAGRKLALRVGAGAEWQAQTMGGIARLFGEARGPAWTQVMADSVLRVSGLNKWTRHQQDQFVTDVMGTLGDNRGRTWGELPKRLRAALERGGMDQFDWTAIRNAPPIETWHGTFVDLDAISNDRGTSDRLADWVLRGRAGAVIAPSPTSQQWATLGTRAGTAGGEIVRNSVQFKGFTAALMTKQARMLSVMSPAQRGSYAAQFLIGMTLFGALTQQLREIAKGNDPLPMDDPMFWVRSMLQGGGLGIAGDLIGTQVEGRIDGIGQFIGGPTTSLVTDAVKATTRSFPGWERKDGTHREADPGGAWSWFFKRHTPGTNVWYARLAFERILWDRLDAELSDTHEDRLEKADKRRTDRGQAQWWSSDSMAPDRAPDLANALTAPPEPQP